MLFSLFTFPCKSENPLWILWLAKTGSNVGLSGKQNCVKPTCEEREPSVGVVCGREGLDAGDPWPVCVHQSGPGGLSSALLPQGLVG